MVARVTALIPAHNEEARIVQTVTALRGIPEIYELIVIDDGSRDATARLAQEAGAAVISLPHNLGKGGALNRGLQAMQGEILALVDADLGSAAADVRKLLAPILRGEADMTIARFPRTRKKGGFGLVKGLARLGIKRMTGFDAEAPLSGQRVMTKQVVSALGGFAAGYGVEVGMTIRAARHGFTIKEIETNMSHAETGRDLRGFLHRGRQFVDVARILTGCWLRGEKK